jgi:c-di-GMP-binding flagellar brake protein YcgR
MSDVKQPLSSRPQPVNIERILRPQTKVDLMVAVNNVTDQVDIRSSMILDLTPDRVIVAQTVPPLGKAQLQRKMEASVVHTDRATSENVRWGWTATVLGLENDYKLNPDAPKSRVVSVINLSRPDDQSKLTKSNVRQAYRLEANQSHGITLTVKPMPAAVHLLNFSAGGFMFSTAKPSRYVIDQNLSFKLTFPDGAPLPVRSLSGEAVIVRLEFGPGEKTIHLGARFQNLDSESRLALPKILHYYMLEEQRRRRQDDDL